MIINELLLEKYRTQKTLDQATNHSLPEYVAETHARVIKLSSALGLSYQYGAPGIVANEDSPNRDRVPL